MIYENLNAGCGKIVSCNQLNLQAMCKHEEKICPRCAKRFECKAGSITECQCYGIKLSDEERAFVEDCYDDCRAGIAYSN